MGNNVSYGSAQVQDLQSPTKSFSKPKDKKSWFEALFSSSPKKKKESSLFRSVDSFRNAEDIFGGQMTSDEDYWSAGSVKSSKKKKKKSKSQMKYVVSDPDLRSHSVTSRATSRGQSFTDKARKTRRHTCNPSAHRTRGNTLQNAGWYEESVGGETETNTPSRSDHRHNHDNRHHEHRRSEHPHRPKKLSQHSARVTPITVEYSYRSTGEMIADIDSAMRTKARRGTWDGTPRKFNGGGDATEEFIAATSSPRSDFIHRSQHSSTSQASQTRYGCGAERKQRRRTVGDDVAESSSSASASGVGQQTPQSITTSSGIRRHSDESLSAVPLRVRMMASTASTPSPSPPFSSRTQPSSSMHHSSSNEEIVESPKFEGDNLRKSLDSSLSAHRKGSVDGSGHSAKSSRPDSPTRERSLDYTVHRPRVTRSRSRSLDYTAHNNRLNLMAVTDGLRGCDSPATPSRDVGRQSSGSQVSSAGRGKKSSFFRNGFGNFMSSYDNELNDSPTSPSHSGVRQSMASSLMENIANFNLAKKNARGKLDPQRKHSLPDDTSTFHSEFSVDRSRSVTTPKSNNPGKSKHLKHKYKQRSKSVCDANDRTMARAKFDFMSNLDVIAERTSQLTESGRESGETITKQFDTRRLRDASSFKGYVNKTFNKYGIEIENVGTKSESELSEDECKESDGNARHHRSRRTAVIPCTVPDEKMAKKTKRSRASIIREISTKWH